MIGTQDEIGKYKFSVSYKLRYSKQSKSIFSLEY